MMSSFGLNWAENPQKNSSPAQFYTHQVQHTERMSSTRTLNMGSINLSGDFLHSLGIDFVIVGEFAKNNIKLGNFNKTDMQDGKALTLDLVPRPSMSFSAHVSALGTS